MKLISKILLLSFFASVCFSVFSQTNRVAVTGWVDDTHFKLRTFDANNTPVYQNIDIVPSKIKLRF